MELKNSPHTICPNCKAEDSEELLERHGWEMKVQCRVCKHIWWMD